MSERDSRPIVLGEICGLYGVRGWVKVFSSTRPREGIFDYPCWSLDSGGVVRIWRLEAGRAQGKGLVAKLGGCDDRDAASELVGCSIRVERSQLPETDDIYWADLVGLSVHNLDGQDLGQVKTLLATGANDVLVVRGERERLIPYLEHRVVRAVDIAGGRILVDWDADF